MRTYGTWRQRRQSTSLTQRTSSLPGNNTPRQSSIDLKTNPYPRLGSTAIPRYPLWDNFTREIVTLKIFFPQMNLKNDRKSLKARRKKSAKRIMQHQLYKISLFIFSNAAFLTPKIYSKHRVFFEFPSSFSIEGATYEIYSKETRKKLDWCISNP